MLQSPALQIALNRRKQDSEEHTSLMNKAKRKARQTYSSGVLTTRTSAPGKCFRKLSANARAASGTTSHTTKDASLFSDSANCFENRLNAISDPIRPRPRKLMLFARARAGDAAAEAYVRIRVAVDRSRARRQAAGKRIAGRIAGQKRVDGAGVMTGCVSRWLFV